jgi:hypothetical protein
MGGGAPSVGGGVTVTRGAHPAKDVIVVVVVPSKEQTQGVELAVSQWAAMTCPSGVTSVHVHAVAESDTQPEEPALAVIWADCEKHSAPPLGPDRQQRSNCPVAGTLHPVGHASHSMFARPPLQPVLGQLLWLDGQPPAGSQQNTQVAFALVEGVHAGQNWPASAGSCEGQYPPGPQRKEHAPLGEPSADAEAALQAPPARGQHCVGSGNVSASEAHAANGAAVLSVQAAGKDGPPVQQTLGWAAPAGQA